MMKTLLKPENDKNKRATEASLIVSLQIAKAGKPHTIAENFLKRCMVEVVKCLLGNLTSQHFEDLQLSNCIVSKRIKCIASSLENELILRLKNSEFFVIQLDESRDVAGLAILLVFVRYPYEKQIEEELLLCNVLEKNSTGEEIFNSIFKYFNEKQIKWAKCIDI